MECWTLYPYLDQWSSRLAVLFFWVSLYWSVQYVNPLIPFCHPKHVLASCEMPKGRIELIFMWSLMLGSFFLMVLVPLHSCKTTGKYLAWQDFQTLCYHLLSSDNYLLFSGSLLNVTFTLTFPSGCAVHAYVAFSSVSVPNAAIHLSSTLLASALEVELNFHSLQKLNGIYWETLLGLNPVPKNSSSAPSVSTNVAPNQ